PFDLTVSDDPLDNEFVDEPLYEPSGPVEVAATPLWSAGYDIDIPMNDRVMAFVRLLSGRLKTFLEEGLSRGVQFLPMVQEVFRAEGLPIDLAYVPLVESAFKPTALSRAKARGIWQFMRGTGLENGLSHDWYIDERADPEKATRAAAKYLKTLSATFDGDWHLALASYNGGPGRVQRAIRRSGRSDFWQLSASSRYLPRETRDYVPLVFAAIIIARNPAEYGLNVQPVAAPRFEMLELPSAVDLRRLAAWIGTPVETIRSLNPELRQWMTPLKASGYTLKVPPGTGDILRAHFQQTAPEHLTTISWHTVKKGDTLATVAKKLEVTRAELAEANGLSIKARITAGQQLMIPRAPELPELVFPPAVVSEVVLASASSESSALTEPVPVKAAAVAAVREPRVVKPAAPAARVHRVRRGDTLFSIARLYRTTVSSIKNWNRLRTDSIQVGQRLRIFNERPATATH
ncbi:MAG: LysM peptidoglycan-binding domain-containing protein, partial [Acidobacteria bacterium]|nr:LysM peptidoglycan-binding domain-containing protein [Acidobacteriota bacterium]